MGELDGRLVAVSGGDDRMVRVWDLATGAPVGEPLSGHTGGVNALAVGVLDGRPVVVSGGEDQTVRVWDLSTWQASTVDISVAILAVAYDAPGTIVATLRGIALLDLTGQSRESQDAGR